MENRLPLMVVAVLLGGCATPLSMGLDAYKAGRNDEAARYFHSCAAEGDAMCMYNVGVMFDNGRISSPDRRGDTIRKASLKWPEGGAQFEVGDEACPE